MRSLLIASLLSSCLALGDRPDPSYARNITVYHVNPKKYGAIPIDMDSGDALGDLMFDLSSVYLLPLACPDRWDPACKNHEASDDDLVVSKLTLEVDTRFSKYAKCNICANGTDGYRHHCEDGTYHCFCSWGPFTIPCEKTVGLQELHTTIGKYSNTSLGKFCQKGADCYRFNIFKKLSAEYPGIWYSTLSSGYCNPSGDGTGECTWRVTSVDKIVTKKCHGNVFGNTVKSKAPDCFSHCGSQSTNTSSSCWADCFYKAVLGPDSGNPGGAVTGMAVEDLVRAWEKPFLPEEQGGCASVQSKPDEGVVTVV